MSNTNLPPANEFPAVPYSVMDFHCERPINSWDSAFELNYGWLVGLVDLNSESDYVRQRIADYLTQLLSLGFSGFRVDAAKHISPDNLSTIFKKFKDNLGGGDYPDDFIAYLEVLIGGEKDLLMCQMNSYNYGPYFEMAMQKAGLSASDIYKIKIWESDYPKEFPICGYWPIKSERYAIENDCHDDQFSSSSSRDMGNAGSVLVLQKNVPQHRYFEEFLFSRTDGNWQIRLVLSSYTFYDKIGAFPFPMGIQIVRDVQMERIVGVNVPSPCLIQKLMIPMCVAIQFLIRMGIGQVVSIREYIEICPLFWPCEDGKVYQPVI
ncbi:hypothetical protein FDP41_001888 [Naegleria fowleri]|uniref:Uncharacterized protein n=1 Tax=Naegleria fowleri TaxID=5763 RepID=A0A6A5BYP2_NAEFO|nr:uncharacterized protein FDP41_001888 [Naegleria fowleri]KAF0978818.1 hypothetical protein FDP41_001888 [Naegleria fowleri]